VDLARTAEGALGRYFHQPRGLRAIIQLKVKLSLCLIKHHAMKMFVDPRWRWVVSFTYWQLYRLGKAPSTQWTEERV